MGGTAHAEGDGMVNGDFLRVVCAGLVLCSIHSNVPEISVWKSGVEEVKSGMSCVEYECLVILVIVGLGGGASYLLIALQVGVIKVFMTDLAQHLGVDLGGMHLMSCFRVA